MVREFQKLQPPYEYKHWNWVVWYSKLQCQRSKTVSSCKITQSNFQVCFTQKCLSKHVFKSKIQLSLTILET